MSTYGQFVTLRRRVLEMQDQLPYSFFARFDIAKKHYQRLLYKGHSAISVSARSDAIELRCAFRHSEKALLNVILKPNTLTL